jgi:nicotinamide-nucleotide amidase
MSEDGENLAARLLDACRKRGWTLATAESCTGGLIIGRLTDLAGSSDVVDRGFITYSNAAKHQMLGVDPALITRVGAVSQEVAIAMAKGALAAAGTSLALAVTGVAGPGGGSEAKPVGTVHFAIATIEGLLRHDHRVLPGNRAAVRAATVEHALAMALEATA